jgi:hydrogenase expression/formation protein HypE
MNDRIVGARLNDDEDEVLRRIEAFRRRRPRLTDEVVTLAHGAGGKASAALTDAVFVEAFANPTLAELGDAATLTLADAGRLVFSTDSYVVSPIRFPGGSIGDLAVNGTVNDLAVSGGVPRWLSAAFVIEEGLPIADLRAVVAEMAAAAAVAGVSIVTGDTKVVPHGAADQLYITTSGVGVVPPGRRLGPELVTAGDRLLVSGPIGAHGMAVLLARGDLALSADIRSDTAPLNGLVEALLSAWQTTGLGVLLDEEQLPVEPVVAGACDLLGIDPLYVANEGRLVAVVPAEDAEAALTAVTAHEFGAGARLIGQLVAQPAGIVALRTAFGGSRIVDMLVGDPLPRIC